MVYFIRSSDYIKIGYTDNPLNRISQIQVSNPDKLEVLLIIEGDLVFENEMHSMFSEDFHRGEWFRYSDTIKKFISDNLQNDLSYYYGFKSADIDLNKQKLKNLRITNGYTLEEIGNRMGITKQAVLDTELREKDGSITLKKAEEYASCIGYQLSYSFHKNTCKHVQKEGESCNLNNNCTYPYCEK